MSDSVFMDILFAQQRERVIFMKSMSESIYHDAYAYAWANGVHPALHASDYSTADRIHEFFSEHFLISKEFVDEVLIYMDDLSLKGKPPTFYELEESFGGRCERTSLVKICRYIYLNNTFDKSTFDALLEEGKHPSEAANIASRFTIDELKMP